MLVARPKPASAVRYAASLWDAFVDHIIKESHFLLLRVKTSPLNLLQRIFDAICSELHSEQDGVQN